MTVPSGMVISLTKIASLHREPDGSTELEVSIIGVKVEMPETSIVSVGVNIFGTAVSALGGSESVGVVFGGRMNWVKVEVTVAVMFCLAEPEPQALDASVKKSKKKSRG